MLLPAEIQQVKFFNIIKLLAEAEKIRDDTIQLEKKILH